MSTKSGGSLQQTDKSEGVDPLFDLVSLANRLKCIGNPESNVEDTREPERRVEPLVALERMRCMSEFDLLDSPCKSSTHEELKTQLTEGVSGGFSPTQKRRVRKFRKPAQNDTSPRNSEAKCQEKLFAGIDLGDSEKIAEMLEQASSKHKGTAGEFFAPDSQSTILNTSEVSAVVQFVADFATVHE